MFILSQAIVQQSGIVASHTCTANHYSAFSMKESGATEFHGSARKIIANPMTFANPNVIDAGSIYLANEEELAKIISILNE